MNEYSPDDVVEYLTALGVVMTQAQLLAIRNADSTEEAVDLAEQAGFDPSTVFPALRYLWSEMRGNAGAKRAEATDLAADQVLLSKMPEGWANRTEMSPEERRLYDENRAQDTVIDELNQLIDQIYATEDEPETTYSPLLFPSLPGGDPDPAAHLRVVTSDEYSPFGTRSRSETYHFAEMNVMSLERDPAKREYWEEQFSSVGAYVSGQEIVAWSQLPFEERLRIEKKMVDAGLLDEEDGIAGYVPGATGMPQLLAVRAAMMRGTIEGEGWELALNEMVAEHQAAKRLADYRGSRGGGRRAQFSVPASMRQIPDYPSLEQEVINLFRQRLGRDPKDYEIGILADDLKVHYQTRNAEMIKAARAAFDQAQSGVSGVMEVEVPDPQLRMQQFLEERYGAELDRLQQIDDTRTTNQLIVNAITAGSQLIGSPR